MPPTIFEIMDRLRQFRDQVSGSGGRPSLVLGSQIAGEDIEDHILRTGSYLVTRDYSFTRPADANAYTVGDVIANSTSAPIIATFPLAARLNGYSGTIVAAALIDSANAATKLLADLILFDTIIAIDNDNAAWTPTNAEMANFVGVVPFLTAASWTAGDVGSVGAGSSAYLVTGLNIPFQTVTGAALFGILIARNAYIPTSGEVLKLRLLIQQH